MTNQELLGTCEWLVAELSHSYLLDLPKLQPLTAEFSRDNPYGDAQQFADFLVERGCLTRFQADKAVEGEARTLVLGPYIVCDLIVTSSLGAVFKAVGKSDHLPYAVRVLPLRSVWNVRLARKQVKALAEIPPHASIVPFVDVGAIGNRHYLVWPLVEGDSLQSEVERRGPLPWIEAARIAFALADGLQYVHARGQYHGLIKPSNIRLIANAPPRLLDFGIGALLAENSDESLLDTMSAAHLAADALDCASPESVLDPAKRSPAGDQYSLGCTLYFALAGRYPFPDGNIVDKMMAHQSMTPAPLQSIRPDIPPDLVAIVDRLMQKHPNSRYRHATELLHELQPLVGTPIPMPPPMLRPVDTPALGSLEDTLGMKRDSTRSLPRLPAFIPPAAQASSTRLSAAIPPVAQSSASHLPPMPPISSPAAPRIEPPISVNLPVRPQSPAANSQSSFLGRLCAKIAFWRSKRDPLAVSILAPEALLPGETIYVPVVAHDEAFHDIMTRSRRYFPGHSVIAQLPIHREIARGTRLTIHLALPGITIQEPVQKLVWNGQPVPLPYVARVPFDCRPGEIVGVLSIGAGADIIKTLEFRISVGRR